MTSEPKPLLLPSLKREAISMTDRKMDEVAVEAIPIDAAEEKAFTRQYADYDADAKDIWKAIKKDKSNIIAQEVSPTQVSNFITNDAYYTEILKDLKEDLRGTGIMGIDLNYFAAKPDRKKQLSDIFTKYYNLDRDPKLQYIFDNDAALKRKINKEDVNMIWKKEMLQLWSPDKISKIIQEEAKMPLTEAQEEILEQIKTNMERDRVNREHGFLSEDDMRKRLLKYNELLIRHIDKNTVERIQSDLKRKSLIDLNILNDQIKRIDAITRANPNSKVSIALNKILDTTLKDLKEGKIDLNQAFDKINGSRKLMKPTIPETLALKISTEPKEEKFETIIPKYDSADPEEREKFYNELRDKGIAAFEGFEFDKGDRIGSYGYSLTENQKDRLYKDLDYIIGNKYEVIIPHGKSKTTTLKYAIDEIDFANAKTFPKDLITKIAFQVLSDLAKRDVSINLDPNKFPIADEIMKSKGTKVTAGKVALSKEIKKIFEQIPILWQWTHDHVTEPKPTPATIAELKLYEYPIGPKEIERKERLRLSLLPKATEIKPSSKLIETNEEKLNREKKYAQENLKYAKHLTREEPETQKAYYGENVIEYNIKNEEQLLNMKKEIGNKLGQLYIVDLKTGRLHPITLKDVFINATYVFMKNPEKGGSFAYYPALHKIYRDEESLIPYKAIQYGRDKRQFRPHQTINNPYTIDYRDQIRNEIGAGFWGAIKKGISTAYHAPINAAKDVGKYTINKTVNAAKDLAKQTVYEGKNFVNQEKKNINQIYSANKQFYKHPSLKNFSNAYNTTTLGALKVVAQPGISTIREAANVSDFVGKVPGLNVVKAGAEFFIPELGVLDSAAHALRDTGVGSNEKPKYLDAAINSIDAITGTGKLNSAVQTGAKILNTGLQITDKFVDKH